MNIEELLQIAENEKASDLHITTGIPPTIRVNGSLKRLNMPSLGPNDSKALIEQLVKKDANVYEKFLEKGEVDFSYAIPQVGRFRVNVFKQRGTYAAALRTVGVQIPSMEELGI